jgi:hypothetical protein
VRGAGVRRVRRYPQSAVALPDLPFGDPLPVFVVDDQRRVDEQQRIGDGVRLDPLHRLVKTDPPAGRNDASVSLERHDAAAICGLGV